LALRGKRALGEKRFRAKNIGQQGEKRKCVFSRFRHNPESTANQLTTACRSCFLFVF